jgi:transcriptional regulator with XRE-family HTH domain/predicted HicB family RNase H-like nuclease
MQYVVSHNTSMTEFCDMSDRHALSAFSFRTSQELRDLLDALAAGNGQSLNAWLLSILEKQFEQGAASPDGIIPAYKLSVRNTQLSYCEEGDLSVYSLRMPDKLRHLLEESANKARRSLNKEIINRVLSAISDTDFQKLLDVVIGGRGLKHLEVVQTPSNEDSEPGAVERNGICSRLKSERKRLNLTQAQAAQVCGISREVWCRYERGMTQAGANVLEAFAKAGANPEFLLMGNITKTLLSPEENLLIKRFRKTAAPVKAATLRMLDNDQ